MKKTILILMVMFSFRVWADDKVTIVAQTDPNDASTKCGDNCTWTLYSDGRFQISGTGGMYAYGQKSGTTTTWTVDGSPWDDYIEQIKSVDVAHGITSIGGSAFKGAFNLKSVQIPSSVISIWEGAFMGCKMPTLRLPDSLKTIGNWAFSENVFSQIDIPSSLESIGTGAFWNTRLKTLVLPDSVKYLGDNAFRWSDIDTMVISDQLNNIDADAFFDSYRLQTIYCTGDIDVCKTNVGEAFSDKVKKATTKKINGVTYVYDTTGKLVARSGKRIEKRIYTLEEAEAVSKKTGNTFKLRYK